MICNGTGERLPLVRTPLYFDFSFNWKIKQEQTLIPKSIRLACD